MNRILCYVFYVMWVTFWLASCSSSSASTPSVSTPTAISTAQISTPTIPSIQTASSTPQLLPISAEASAYLTEALDFMQNNSLYRESIDWDELRKSTFEVAQYAQTPEDTYGAIRYALVRLGDHHSFFFTPYELQQRSQQTESDSPAPRGKFLLEKIGFIALEGYTALAGEQYATDAQ